MYQLTDVLPTKYGLHAVIAADETQPSGNAFDAADLDRVAPHLQLADDPDLLRHEFSCSRLVVQLVREFCNWIL
jgi:hypothetical protein